MIEEEIKLLDGIMFDWYGFDFGGTGLVELSVLFSYTIFDHQFYFKKISVYHSFTLDYLHPQNWIFLREDPWLFITFNIIIRHIFPEIFIEISQVVWKIWRYDVNINYFQQFFGFFDPAILLKKRLPRRCFSVNFMNFLIISFFIDYLWLHLQLEFSCSKSTMETQNR